MSNPILERLEEIVARAFRAVGMSERVDVRRALRVLLADTFMEGNTGTPYKHTRAEVLARFGVTEKEKRR